MSPKTNSPKGGSRRRSGPDPRTVDAELQTIVQYVAELPEALDDPALLEHLAKTVGGADLARRYLQAVTQRDQVLKVLKGLQESRRLAWVVSPSFPVGSNGTEKRYLHARAIGARHPELYAVVDEALRENAAQVPHLGWVTRTDPFIYLGPADDIPPPPIQGEIRDAVKVGDVNRFAGLAEVVVESEGGQRVTVLSEPTLAGEVERRLDDGETVSVRVESGVLTAIQDTGERDREDWLEFPEEGPGLSGLILHPRIRRGFDRDIRNLVSGKGFLVELIGPTGVGKTDGASRIGHDAVRLIRKKGERTKGLALITLTAGTIGSSYIHAVSRNLAKALKRAKGLAKRGYVVIVLMDEIDGMFGEATSGLEHGHQREERLHLQSALSEQLPGVGIYFTRNPRSSSHLSAALVRRMRTRVFGRPVRSQIAAVAALYCTEDALELLGVSRQELGTALADALFSEDRVVATAHLHSGASIPIRVRDLHVTSPGKVKSLVESFCEDLEDGEEESFDGLLRRIDEEFTAVDVSPRNFGDLTFLRVPKNDTIRGIELAR